MNKENHLIKKIQIQPEEETCNCGCQGQENINFKKSEQKQIFRVQSKSS
ncbi:MAG: hypothetical protein ACXABO_18380 [Promethearchaeota archaeon]|jgi:hypothetical protein